MVAAPLNALVVLANGPIQSPADLNGFPPYDELILVTHRDRVDDHALRKFIDGIEAGVQFLVNHPEKSWQLFIRGRENLDDELNKN